MIIKRILTFIGGRRARGFCRRKSSLNRSRLVGMYLAQTNGREANSTSFLSVRERRNGRFSQTRDRS